MLRTYCCSVVLALSLAVAFPAAAETTVGKVVDASLLAVSKIKDELKAFKGPPLKSITLNLTVTEEDKAAFELKLAPINAKGEVTDSRTNKLKLKFPIEVKKLNVPAYIQSLPKYKKASEQIYKSGEDNRRVSDELAETILNAMNLQKKFTDANAGIEMGPFAITVGINTKAGGAIEFGFDIGAAAISLGGGTTPSYAQEFVFAFGEDPRDK